MITKLKSLKNHQGFMKYFKNTSWLFAEKILRMVVGLFVGIWVARYLGPEQFGLFSYAQSFVGLFTAIATLGLDGIVVRELVNHEHKRDTLLGTAFVLKLIGAFIVLILLAVAISFTSNDYYTNMLIFIIASATIFQSFNVIDMYFQSKVVSKYIVYANVIALFITSIIKVILILNEAPLIAFVWVVFLNSVILAIGYLYFYFHNHMSFRQWKFEKQTAISLVKDSWPLILAGTAVIMNQKIDQIMIKEFLGIKQVGYYAVAINLIDVLIFLPFLASKSIFPSYVKSHQENKKRFEEKMIWGYRVFFIGTLVPALFFSLFAENIIVLLYGNMYIKSVEVLHVYSLLLIFSSIGAINTIYFRTTNQQKKVMNRHLTNIAINVILNYIFIPKYGIIAAAYTSLFSIVFTTIIYDIFDSEMKNLNSLKIKFIIGRQLRE